MKELREKGRTFDEMNMAKTYAETQVMELEAERDDLTEQIDAPRTVEEMVSDQTNQDEGFDSKSEDLAQSVHHLVEQIGVVGEKEENLSLALEVMTNWEKLPWQSRVKWSTVKIDFNRPVMPLAHRICARPYSTGSSDMCTALLNVCSLASCLCFMEQSGRLAAASMNQGISLFETLTDGKELCGRSLG